MRRLFPSASAIRSATNSVVGFLIPGEIKQQAIGGFLAIVKDMTPREFEAFVGLNTSLWRELLTVDLRDALKEGSKDYSLVIKAADPAMVFGWVLEARPDLAVVLDNDKGKLWFVRNWNEIMQELPV